MIPFCLQVRIHQYREALQRNDYATMLCTWRDAASMPELRYQLDRVHADRAAVVLTPQQSELMSMALAHHAINCPTHHNDVLAIAAAIGLTRTVQDFIELNRRNSK